MVNHKIITTVHKVASVSPIIIIESQILYPTVPFRPNSSLFLFIFPFLLLLLFFLYKEIFVSLPPPALLYTSRNTFRDLLPTTHSREITGGSDLSAISDSPAARTERRSWKIGGARDASNARFPRFPSLFPVRCPLQSGTYPGNKIGFRDRGGIAGSRRDNLESPRNERRYRFFSFPFFFSSPLSIGPQFFPKIAKTLEIVRVSEQFVDVYTFSRIHSLNFHRKFHWFCATQQVAFVLEKNPSILPLFVPARCSVSLARHGKPRNDFNHVNEIAWNFFPRRRGTDLLFVDGREFRWNRFTSGTQSRSAGISVPITTASGLFFRMINYGIVESGDNAIFLYDSYLSVLS